MKEKYSESHRQIYDKLKKLAHTHRIYMDKLARKERKKFGFEHPETDIDPIIDTLSYGINSLSFEEYLEYMEEHKNNPRRRRFDYTGD